MRISLKAALPAISLALFSVVPAFSSTIVLGMTGDAQVGSNYVDFGVFPVGAPYAPAPGTGIFEVTSPVANIFQTNGVTAGEFGTIQSIDASMEPIGSVLSTPINFINFIGGGSNLDLYLTELFPGNIPVTPPSPFVLQDTTQGATAAVDFAGYILNTTDNSKTAYTGLFQATFSGMTVAQLEAAVPVDTAFSGTLSLTPTITPTPEPASLLLMGLGLVGAGIVARKKTAVRS